MRRGCPVAKACLVLSILSAPMKSPPSPGRGISDLVAFLCSAGDNPVATILFGFIQRLVSLFHRLIKALFSSALGDANIGDDIAM